MLNDISNLATIDTAILEKLGIINNPSLKECDIESICNYLNLHLSVVNINNNATGCNSKEEVNTQNKISLNLKNHSFKMKHAPNLYRCTGRNKCTL